MADPEGWNLVVAHPATEIREEKQIEEWEKVHGHWSGVGKHPTNWNDHTKLKVSNDRELGVGSYGVVERITYKAVTLARKHVKPRRGVTVEKLREEATVMERLAHKHILKLVGTYTLRRNDLYLLLYPAAVCDLSRFLDDIDDIRSGTCYDREDAFKRLQSLGLKDVGAIEDLPVLRNPVQPANSPRPAIALGFLQQMLGCITEALAFVHEKGIRHRDLKPKNILLSQGRVYLADFGIARDVSQSEDSITSARCGTRFWIAPEVHDEQDHRMSPADIFALGCIFLNIATVLYGESLEKYDMIMKDQSWTKKYELLPTYLQYLRVKATTAKLGDEKEPNFNAKNILGLVEQMLQHNPASRPTAIQVNARLSELGGLDQIYHLKCCHKVNTYVSQVINTKLKSIHDVNATSLLRISQLETENAKHLERLAYLESVRGTWEQRIENERKHAGKQYEALLEKYNREVESRKALEERLKVLEMKPARRQRSQNRGKGRSQGILHANSTGNGKVNGNGNVGQNGILPNLPRRTSRVPLPVRPSTPIRPILPTRDPGSTSSTMTSSGMSTFSRASIRTNSFSSVGSSTIRSSSPESPTTAKPPSSPVLAGVRPTVPTPGTNGKAGVVDAGVMGPPLQVPKPSWANMVARSASAKA